MIENDLETIKGYFQILTKKTLQELARNSINSEEHEHFKKARVKEEKLLFRFCKHQEVNRKRKSMIIKKSCFLQKMSLLKSQGIKQELLFRIQCFLEDNLEELYEERREQLMEAGFFETHNNKSIKSLQINQGELWRKELMEKRHLLDNMFKLAETLINLKFFARRCQRLELTMKKINPKISYFKKNLFLEKQTGKVLKYFENHRQTQK